jgi:RNA polymerase sigma-70 factor (ECF subfamily)
VSFDDVYRQHHRAVRSRVLSVVGLERVDDATQDAWLKIWRRLDTYRGEAALSSWLYRVATNAALDSLRRDRRLNRRLEFHADLLELEDRAPDPAPSPLRRCIARRDYAATTAALETLPASHRAVVTAMCFDGLTMEDAAARLRMSLGAVKSRLNRAHTRLRATTRERTVLHPLA